MNNAPHTRMIDGLTPKELAKLQAIKTVNDIKTVSFVEEWLDAFALRPCVGVKLNGVPVSFWWLVPEAAGAFRYADSKKAKKVILAALLEALDIFVEEEQH